jgi:hypothetical protein
LVHAAATAGAACQLALQGGTAISQGDLGNPGTSWHIIA